MSLVTGKNMNEHRETIFENKRFYSVKEAAAMLNISEVTVRTWIYRGKLTAYRTGAEPADRKSKRGRLKVLGSDLNPMISVAYERDV